MKPCSIKYIATYDVDFEATNLEQFVDPALVPEDNERVAEDVALGLLLRPALDHQSEWRQPQRPFSSPVKAARAKNWSLARFTQTPKEESGLSSV